MLGTHPYHTPGSAPAWLFNADHHPLPLPVVSPGSAAPSLLDATLAARGLSAEMFGSDSLTVAAGSRVVLTERTATLDRARVELWTADLAEYKRWVGLPDQAVQAYGARVTQPLPLTPAPQLESTEAPGSASLAELTNACAHYLFGLSDRVAAYRRAIERHLGPFPLTVVALDRITIEAGGVLELSGLPTVLVARRMTIHAGGRCDLLVPGHVVIERLTRPQREVLQ